MFITFEGIDGSGKTTQAELLRAHLESSGRTVRIAREPGGTELGERIRDLLLDGPALSPQAEASLFAAARAELVDRVIRPELDQGHVVVLDRYLDSSLAYQCGGRGLELEPVLAWNRFCVGGLEPDLTFLLALPAEDAGTRVDRRLSLFRVDGGESPPDRIESESLEFRRAVEEAYRELARLFSERVVEIDAELPKEEIAIKVRARVERFERAAAIAASA